MNSPVTDLDHRAEVMSGFAESLREPRTPHISPKRFSAALGVPAAGLATLAGVHRNTLRNPASERLQDKLREMLKAITAAAALTGDMHQALYWYRNEPLADYGFKTAAELVADGHLDAVLALLRDLENGANG